MTTKNIVGLIARIFVGVVFVASAVTKYISIEAVDLFVYEHQIFSWSITTFATRFLIVIEAFIGFMLLLGIFPKLVKWSSIILLLLFNVYVLLKPVLFNVDSENCHCFGTILLLNDNQTLIKNIILLLISYFMFWDKGAVELKYKLVRKKLKTGEVIERNKRTLSGFLYNKRRIISIILFILLLLVTNSIFPADPIARKVFPTTASIDKEKFDILIGLSPSDNLSNKDTTLRPLYDMAKDSIQNIGATNGKKILCLYSTGCKYCKRAAIRLDVVRKRYDISDSSFAIVFWGSATKIDSFFVKTNTKVLPHTIVHPIPFLAATKGKQPIIVLLNNGKVEKLLKYPNINEKEIAFFLTTNK